MASGLGTELARLCQRTRLQLVRAPVAPLHRIAKQARGSLDPILRGHETNRLGWGRWDTAGGRTVYAGATAFGAFAEVLPYIRQNLPETPLGELFDDIPAGQSGLSLAAAILAEMPAAAMHNTVTQGWRTSRARYELKVATDEWFVDVGAVDTIAAINSVFKDEAAERPLTLTDLTGEDRYLTTRIAGWLRSRILDDGTQARGIYYVSKYGSNLPSYAIWLHATDDGNPARERVQETACRSIARDDADLVRAARIHSMRIW